MEHEYFKDFVPTNPANCGSQYNRGSKKNFFNPSANKIDTSINGRGSSGRHRLESRKKKLESQGKVSKEKFYESRKKPTGAPGGVIGKSPYSPGGYNKKFGIGSSGKGKSQS